VDTHPWTKYEIARIRDEERLLQARSARLANEARAGRQRQQEVDPVEAGDSLVERLRRLGLAVKRAPAGSGA
jgi:hypothetical protein